MTPLDGEGNYYADLPDGPSGTGTGTLRTIGVGVGAPNESTPVTTIYIDSNTGFVYTNATSVSGAWTLAGGGASGTPVYTGSFDNPNSNVTPTTAGAAAWYFKDSADAQPVSIWQWSVSGQIWRPVLT